MTMRGCDRCHHLIMDSNSDGSDSPTCLDCRLPHVTVEHTTDPDAQCPRCHFVTPLLPTWVYFGALLRMEGRTWRIVTMGSSNRRTPQNYHHEPMCHIEPADEHWDLPDAPCPVSDVGAALAELRSMRVAYAADLAAATFLSVVARDVTPLVDVHYRDFTRRRLGCKMSRDWKASDKLEEITCVECAWIAIAEAA